ncbi:MAG: methyltransferase domain-containing protein [Acidimicrobiia bacterium]
MGPDAIWETGRIPDHGIIPTGYERTLPPEAQLLVRARRRALTRTAAGRVLDLGGADTHRSLWTDAHGIDDVTVLDGVADPRLDRLAADGERFDTVVSVFQLASAPQLDRTLRAVRAVLADDGRVLFVEPAAQVGFAGRLQRLVAPPLGGVTGWRPDRDLPMELRAAELSVIDIRRHRVPTLQPWLRQVLEGVAHHRLAPGGRAETAPAADPA